MLVGVICWVVLGLVAGFFASNAITGHARGVPLNIALGIAGAMVGGWLFSAFGTVEATGFNLWSLYVASIGAALLLAVAHALRNGAARAREVGRGVNGL
jgi:uncharacterized membrane protein YeaQ/YmgE (transglycosylase-associated protein family)